MWAVIRYGGIEKVKKKIPVIVLNILVIAWLIILQSTKVSATLGNIESLVYSDDEFDDDKSFATSLKSTFATGGLKASLWTRPASEYGINSIMSNSDCTYISAQGSSDGSVIELKKNSVYYRPDNVVKGMNGNLVFLSVCYGAKTDSSSGANLCSTIVNRGYRAAIGYKAEVGVEECRAFEKEFFYNWVVEKKYLLPAFTTARDYVSSRYGSSNAVVTSAAYFGNGALKH